MMNDEQTISRSSRGCFPAGLFVVIAGLTVISFFANPFLFVVILVSLVGFAALLLFPRLSLHTDNQFSLLSFFGQNKQ